MHGSYTAVLALLLLCGFTTFLDRSIRLRADLVSTLFSLPGHWAVVYPSLHPLFLGIAGFFLGLSVLTTQKALYFVAGGLMGAVAWFLKPVDIKFSKD